jgi:hypothetical protein
MATVTPVYNWPVPTSTDYVKDGATSIEALGDAIDASLNSITSGKDVGMVLINATTITAQTTVNIDNIFTSSFRNYRIVTALTTIAGSGGIYMKMRAAGTTNSNSNYAFAATGYISNNAGTNGYSNGLSNTGFELGYVANALGGLFSNDMMLYNPQQTQYTTFTSDSVTTFNSTNNYTWASGGLMSVTTAYDGLALSGPANMTGVIRIYGMKD